ncbi:hypothetical protein JKP88DRAFT_241019 [Tribonema minus]|uniref:Uncharacterized protein n=1 Tax=Tribonema minus TaxID=303371 RepID=A0A835Z7J9_9STRA|nr:hypothetical protein JKP88DRAFT_241019 [Tribonema minus]
MKTLNIKAAVFARAKAIYQNLRALLRNTSKHKRELNATRTLIETRLAKMIEPSSGVALRDETLFVIESVETIYQQCEQFHNVARGIYEVYTYMHSKKVLKRPQKFNTTMLDTMYSNTVSILGSTHSASMTLEKVVTRTADDDIKAIILEFTEAMIPFTVMNLFWNMRDVDIWRRVLSNQENIVGTSPFIDVELAATSDPASKAPFIPLLVAAMKSRTDIVLISTVETASLLVGRAAYSALCAINLANDRKYVDDVLANEVLYGKHIFKFLSLTNGQERSSSMSAEYISMADTVMESVGQLLKLDSLYSTLKSKVETELLSSSAAILESFTYTPGSFALP